MEYTIDATNKKFGRLASEIAVILQGKKIRNMNRVWREMIMLSSKIFLKRKLVPKKQSKEFIIATPPKLVI